MLHKTKNNLQLIMKCTIKIIILAEYVTLTPLRVILKTIINKIYIVFPSIPDSFFATYCSLKCLEQ